MIPLESHARNLMQSSSGATAVICPCNFQDHFDQENSDLWLKSDWGNVDLISLNAWLPDPNHIRISGGNLQLILNNEPCVDDVSLCHGQNFASGQYYTACDDFRYGSFSARIIAGKGNGVITSMYLYGDPGATGEQDEIDIEIFGKDAIAPGKWEMQTNYFRKGDMGDCWVPWGIPEPCHVGVIPLNFDPTKSYHNYTFSWIGKEDVCTDIKWYVDEKLRRHVWRDRNGYIHSSIFDESGNTIESSKAYPGSLPSTECRIMLGLWAALGWELAGEFNYVSPITAKFDWMKVSQPTGIGLFRPSTARWYLDYDNNGASNYQVTWGASADKPLAGDWDGDSMDEIGLFRPSTARWYLDYDNNGASNYQVTWGASTDIPVAGDWDGDGKDEIGLFRPSTRMWYLDYDNNGASDYQVTWGDSTDIPVAGDWNGDGKDEIGLFRPSTRMWYLDYDNNGASDYRVNWGDSTDIPVTGDWDGDGKGEIGLYRPSTSRWYLDYDNNGVSNYQVTWGASTDKPVTGCWN
ncbi:MAG: family 16 glycosylhydrolase [Methanothrix sp.]